MVASSQPLATEAGILMLRSGGTAVDAAVAMAAVLCVVEPGSTDLGGDFFMLVKDGGNIRGVNGSGKSPAALTMEDMPWGPTSPHAVTVPGCVAAWVDSHDKMGKLPLREVLAPAIRAAGGFPIAPMAFAAVQEHRSSLPLDFLADATEVGAVVSRRELKTVLENIAKNGKKAFYDDGPTARAIVKAVPLMTLEDLKAHETILNTKPLSVDFHGVTAWEHGPNAAGLVVLLALQTLRELGVTDFSTPEAVHLMIKALKLAFRDARAVVCDPSTCYDVELMLTTEYAIASAKKVSDDDVIITAQQWPMGPDTASFQAVDAKGRFVSAVNSTYQAFGSKIVASGFTLQNRGFNFSRDPAHPNCVEGAKRPYHTIIPCILTGKIEATLTNMGGFMQPQGHVQHIVNLLFRGMDPQASVDAPRFCIDLDADVVRIEPTYGDEIITYLRARGHAVHVLPDDNYARAKIVGKAQIITRSSSTGVLVAGSDPRADGCAMGF
ncbi:hypothetical protein CTAYLR_009347 [Chrysophaeum taylorii]|uniref:Gamma-glutamyltransferase n=1 Tax=Chrysophaeum taylorii TaxID=2483200 RepID=A0AAD7UAY0_9STRA|nr:hypothetical protein CTAYLR_009347 [Chrysophaeum taylorii]